MDEEFVRKRITELRLQKNISERAMSLDLGHSPSYINGIMSHKQLPSVSELLYICEYFGITPQEFFDEERQTTLLQKQAIDAIYELSEEDLVHVTAILERLRCKNR